jgi:hypothetical protein
MWNLGFAYWLQLTVGLVVVGLGVVGYALAILLF